MERKDLKPIEREVEVYFGTYETESVYDKAEADSVMDAIEERIKELELALENSREHSKALRKCFEGHRKQIKELEADKLRQENYCESLVNENKRLNEIIIFKDMVGAELHNENKELKQKLETRIAMWEHERNLRKDEEILFTDGEFILEKVK